MTRQTKWTRQKNKRGDRKGESNDRPEILDRGVVSDISNLPSRYKKAINNNKKNKDPGSGVKKWEDGVSQFVFQPLPFRLFRPDPASPESVILTTVTQHPQVYY